MRTLKLTHEQIAIIQNALGIAEKTYTDIHKTTTELSTVRGNEYARQEQRDKAMAFHDLACEFADINISIKNGDLDV